MVDEPLDGLVTAVLVWWHFVGANTSDDGYILTMARVSEHAGYMANYYRWFGTPEAPFGWYYDLLALWAHVSTTSVWMRLPTLLMALACWWVISREVIPRLGDAVKTSQRRGVDRGGHVPGLLAAAEQRAATRADHRAGHPADLVLGRARRWPPAGCYRWRSRASSARSPCSPVRRASRPSARCWSRSARCAPSCTDALGGSGCLPLLAPDPRRDARSPLILIFRDQTFVGELQASSFKSAVGPSLSWFDEHIRYERLFMASPGRVGGTPVRGATLLLALAVSVAMSLRKGRIPGTAAGPSRRIIGITIISFLAMMFTPTKWTHHFGVFAGLAGSLGALAAVAVTAARHALAPQPDDIRRHGAVRDGAVVRHRQRLVVRLELRCAVVEPVPRVEFGFTTMLLGLSVRRAPARRVVPFLRP